MRWRHGPTALVAMMVSGCLVAGVVMTGCGGGQHQFVLHGDISTSDIDHADNC
jgi:hypothetical protein